MHFFELAPIIYRKGEDKMYQIDSSNRILMGELMSNTYLTNEIARLTATQISATSMRPSARKEREGWIAVLEDREGTILLFKSGFKSEAEAKNVAREALLHK